MSINQYTFSGNLGSDAEVRVVNNTSLVSFSVAVTENFKDANDQWQEKTTWVRCTWWKRDEKTAKHLVKGAFVAVSGKPSANAYDSNGEIKASLEVNVSVCHFQTIKDGSGF